MVKTISPREAKSLLDAGGFDLIDVREPDEWATGHVSSARLVPLGSLRADPAAAGLRDKTLFICAKGGRSMTAAQLAESRGLRDLYSVDGGTSGWIAAGLPVDVPARAPADETRAGVVSEPPDESISPELDSILAENFRALREQRGLSLDTLAGLSGVGRQTLGQIEIGRATPSLGTLWKIARAFDVPFSTLLARNVPLHTTVLRAATAKRIVSTDGRFASRALFLPDSHAKAEFYELWLAGHGREDAEAHATGTHEYLVVTAGRLVMHVGKDRYELEKGDAINFVADVPHAYVNPAGEECWMNLVMTY